MKEKPRKPINFKPGQKVDIYIKVGTGIIKCLHTKGQTNEDNVWHIIRDSGFSLLRDSNLRLVNER